MLHLYTIHEALLELTLLLLLVLFVIITCSKRYLDSCLSTISALLQLLSSLTPRGALTLASPEVKFEIDTETHDPLDVGMYQVKEANHMVEEMMLLANITVADHILKHFPAQALLRRHPVPPPRQFEPLLKAAVAAGVSINPETSLVRPLSALP